MAKAKATQSLFQTMTQRPNVACQLLVGFNAMFVALLLPQEEAMPLVV